MAKSDNSKALSIVSYITFIGLLIALLAGDWKEDETLHRNVNQALVIMLFSLLSAVPYVGWIWAMFMLVLWIMGLVGACSDDGFREVPLLGQIHII